MNSKAPVIILHYSPVELYPPVINFLRFISRKGNGRKWIIISTRQSAANMGELAVPGIQIIRRGVSGSNLNRVKRVFGYFSYHFSAVFFLLRYRPFSILYYETLSSLPVVIYRFLFRSKTKCLVHYHEYVSSEEYLKGSFFFRFLNRMEKAVLPHVSWISHTNRERLEMFNRDIHLNKSVQHVLPNYPPASWKIERIDAERAKPFKLVYVGSLSLDTLYLREFALWVLNQQGGVIWDIYSFAPDRSAVDFLSSLKSESVSFRGAVNYDELPGVLRTYDAGVILYKGHIPNYVYNAPNKLFEYHVCGLDVWFPSVMLGCLPYVTRGTFPKITALDFERLEDVKISDLTDRNGLRKQIGSFACDDVFKELLTNLEND